MKIKKIFFLIFLKHQLTLPTNKKSAAMVGTTDPNVVEATMTLKTTVSIQLCPSVWKMISTRSVTYPESKHTRPSPKTEKTISSQVEIRSLSTRPPSLSTTLTISTMMRIICLMNKISRYWCLQNKAKSSRLGLIWAKGSVLQFQTLRIMLILNQDSKIIKMGLKEIICLLLVPSRLTWQDEIFQISIRSSIKTNRLNKQEHRSK